MKRLIGLISSTVLTSAGATLLLGSAPALAQQIAVSGADEASVLGEVTVTAQFRAENLQETPLAITALSGDLLEQRSLTNMAELAATAPNVNFAPGGTAFGNITQAFIRGIGQGDFNFAFEPGVGMYIDDVYYGTMFGTVFDLLDVDRIEVLRGPQGILFGKNSIGGAVRMVSRKPSGDGAGYAEATVGDFDRIDVRGAVDVALVPDRLFARVSAVSKQRDGYQDVIDFACANPSQAGTLPPRATGPGCKLRTYGGEDVQAARLSLRIVPSDRWEINLTGQLIEDNSELQADTLLAVDTGSGTVAVFQDGGVGTMTAAEAIGLNSAGGVNGGGGVLAGLWNLRVNQPTFGIDWDSRFITGDLYKQYGTYTNFEGVAESQERTVDSWNASAVVDINFTDNLALKWISGFLTYDGNISHDADLSPLSIQIANSTIGSDEFTQELRLTGQVFNERLDWTVGGFYYDVENTLDGPVILDLFGADADPWGDGCPGSPVTCPPVPPLRFMQDDRIESTSKSGYVHGIFAITDRLNVFGGYRYTEEEKSYFFDHSGAIPGVPGSGFFAIAVPATVSYSRSDYRAGADFNITDDVMVYAQASTGYRSGGVNPRPFSPTQLTTFGPEEATAYEVGLKSDLFGRRLRANLAVFQTDYKDRIVNQQIVDNSGIPFTGPINLGTATVQGAEVELNWAPVDNLLISGTYGYLDIELDPQDGAPAGFIDGCVGPPNCTAPIVGTIPEGSITPGVPEESASAGVQYAFQLGADGGSLTPRVDWSWRSRIFYDNANTQLASQEGFSLVNARLTWDAADGKLSVAGFVTNLTEEEYFMNKFTLLPFGLGTLEGQPGRPREWGLSLKYRFE